MRNCIRMKAKFIHKIGPFFGLFLFAIALVVLYHELRVYHLHDLLGNIKSIPCIWISDSPFSR